MDGSIFNDPSKILQYSIRHQSHLFNIIRTGTINRDAFVSICEFRELKVTYRVEVDCLLFNRGPLQPLYLGEKIGLPKVLNRFMMKKAAF